MTTTIIVRTSTKPAASIITTEIDGDEDNATYANDVIAENSEKTFHISDNQSIEIYEGSPDAADEDEHDEGHAEGSGV